MQRYESDRQIWWLARSREVMRKISVKITKLMIYPKSEDARKYINRDAYFEMLVADHAYQRNMQRFKQMHEKYGRKHEGEGLMSFFERSACEVCVKALNMGAKPSKDGIINMIRNEFIWVFDMSRGVPALVTLYPRDRKMVAGEVE